MCLGELFVNTYWIRSGIVVTSVTLLCLLSLFLVRKIPTGESMDRNISDIHLLEGVIVPTYIGLFVITLE